MKKFISLGLTLALLACLAVPAFASDIEAGWTAADGARGAAFPEQYAATITVDGADLDLSGIPGAPDGYIPMRAFCDGAGTYVDWFAEDNEAFFTVDGLGVVVNLGDMSVLCDFEPVEDVTAYLNPAGYTFLPASFLATFANIKMEVSEDGSHYDFITKPDRSPLQALADSIVEAAEVGATMELSLEDAASFGIDPDNFAELVVLFPMMSANPSSVYLAEVAEGKMDAAKENFNAVAEFLMQSFGNYPTSAEMIGNGKIVESPDGAHLLYIVSLNNEAGIALFEEAFPSRER